MILVLKYYKVLSVEKLLEGAQPTLPLFGYGPVFQGFTFGDSLLLMILMSTGRPRRLTKATKTLAKEDAAFI